MMKSLMPFVYLEKPKAHDAFVAERIESCKKRIKDQGISPSVKKEVNQLGKFVSGCKRFALSESKVKAFRNLEGEVYGNRV